MNDETLDTSVSNKQILRDAEEKHGIKISKKDWDAALSLVTYARHLGYNDGYQDGKDDCHDEYD